MKIDLQYIKDFLQKCEDSETATFNLLQILPDIGDYDRNQDEILFFHLNLLLEIGLIENRFPAELYNKISGGKYNLQSHDLRLTYQGHEFLDSLKNDTVWNEVKDKGKKASLGTIILIAKTMLTEIIKAQFKLVT